MAPQCTLMLDQIRLKRIVDVAIMEINVHMEELLKVLKRLSPRLQLNQLA
jgi:hypothetical protein